MERNLFFNPKFRMEFDWKGKYHLRVGSVLPHNKKQISDGLRDMSPESIRNRFLGSKREFSDKELEYLTTLDGWNHYAIGIEERDEHNRGVAIIRMVRSSHSESEAEIAVTIIDEYQGKGLGTFLINLIILAALERDIEKLSFTFLPQNQAIIKLICRAGIPIPGNNTRDYEQLFLDLTQMNEEVIKAQLVTSLPGIGTFHSKT